MLDRGSSHDTTGGTTARITRLKRVGMTALAQIILTSVNNNATAEDRVGTKERDMLV